jgi:hypothetical protein
MLTAAGSVVFGPRYGNQPASCTGLTLQLTVDALPTNGQVTSSSSALEEALRHFWWECTPSSIDDDDAVQKNFPEGHSSSSLWLRHLRCVLPPPEAQSVDDRSDERSSHGRWMPGDFLVMRRTSDDCWFATNAASSESVAFGGVWALDRLPAGRVVLTWIPYEPSAIHHGSAWTCSTVFRVTVALPPLIDVHRLLDCRRQANDTTGVDDTQHQLDVMQCLLDAAQDVGYFFVVTHSGCDSPNELLRQPVVSLGKRCVTVIQQAVDEARLNVLKGIDQNLPSVSAAVDLLGPSGDVRHTRTASSPFGAPQDEYSHSHTGGCSDRHGNTLLPPLVAPVVCKYTIHSSTGSVKVSSNPLVYQHIVPPAWLTDNEVTNVVLPYYDAAKELALVLMEALTQDAVIEEQLFLLLRAVVYPPPPPPSSPIKTPDDAASESWRETMSVGMSPSLPPPTTLDAHTDKSWITLLLATSFHGLMFQAADGSFEPVIPVSVTTIVIAAPCCCPQGGMDSITRPAPSTTTVLRVDSDVVAVNIGDAFQMSSKGAFLSRPHMAVYNQSHVLPTAATGSQQCRVSLPLFVEPAVGFWPTPYESKEVVTMAL